MTASTLRHKHIQLDQRKLDGARRVLRAQTEPETETLDRALDRVVAEVDIDGALRATRGKGKLGASSEMRRVVIDTNLAGWPPLIGPTASWSLLARFTRMLSIAPTLC